jgi:uncharacterized protein (DUF427 family)
MTLKAVWNGALIAQSDDTVVVEGNHYFPLASVNAEYFVPSTHNTICSWKGKAEYYSLLVHGKINENAVWFYADPKPEAEHVRGRVAFWHGVQVGP